jgi:hypothetical protein
MHGSVDKGGQGERGGGMGGGGGGEDEIRFDAREILVEIGFGEGAVSSNGRGVVAIWDSG